MRVGVSIVPLVAALVCAVPIQGADDARLKTEVTALLTEGWPLGPDGVAAAIGHFDAARRLAPTDVRPIYAMAVTQIRQRKYVEAAATLNDVLQRKKDHLTAWQAKIWLSMVARKYDAALADVERLIEVWPEASAVDASDLEETSRFLGRLFGFLWGPANGKVADDRLEELEERIAAKVASAEKATFAESRASVLGKFTNLQDKTEATRDQAKQDEEKQKLLDRERLAAEKSGVDKEKGTIDQQATAARAAADTQLKQLSAAMQQLDAQFNALAARAAVVQAEIGALLAQEQSLLAQAENTDSRSERQRLRDQAAFIAGNRIRAEAVYAGLDAQARGVNAQRSANLQQQQQVTAQYQGEMKRLGLKAETLERTEKRIAGELKKAVTPATGNTAGVRTLSTTAAVFVTYFDFPVDREKRRLLDSFEGK